MFNSSLRVLSVCFVLFAAAVPLSATADPLPRLQLLCALSGASGGPVDTLEADVPLFECAPGAVTRGSRFLSATPGECWPSFPPRDFGTISLPGEEAPGLIFGAFQLQKVRREPGSFRVCGAVVTLSYAAPVQTPIAQSAVIAEGDEENCRGTTVRRGDSFYLASTSFLDQLPHTLNCRFTVR